MTTSFFVNNGGNTSARETISADLTASTNSKNDAEKYAVHPEDATYTLSDGVTTGKSALHYQAKAEDSQLAAAQSEANASASAGIANAAKLAAQAAEAAVSSASSGYVTETGSQTISGVKTFTTNPVFSSGLTVASLVSNGAVTPDSIGMADGKIIGFGASEDRGNNWNGVAQGNHFDLEIRHDGSNSYIKDFGTGNLAIEAADLSLRDDSNNRRVYCTDGASGSVALYYGDSSSGSKLDTTNTGVNVTGTVKSDALDIDGAVDIDTGSAEFNVNTGNGDFVVTTGTGDITFKSTDNSHSFALVAENDQNGNNTSAPDFCIRKTKVQKDSGGSTVTAYDMGDIRFESRADNGDNIGYARIKGSVVEQAATNTASDGDAKLDFMVMNGASTSAVSRLSVDKNGIEVTGNVSADGLTVDGSTTFNTGATANGVLIDGTGGGTGLQIRTSETATLASPDLTFTRTGNRIVGGATNVGQLHFDAKNSNSGNSTFAEILGRAEDYTEGDEDGSFLFRPSVAGTLTTILDVDKNGITVTGAADISGDLTLSAGGDGALTFGAASSIKVIDNSATALVIEEANTAYMTFNTANSGGEKIEFGKPIHGTLTGDVTGNVTGNVSGTALTVTQAAQTAITSVGSLTGLTMAATSASVGGKILFKEGTDNGTNSVTLQGPASTADVTVTLPTSAGTLALTSDIGFVAPTTVVGSAAISDMTSNISKKYVHTGGAVTLKFPNVTASSNLGNTWVVVNAGTDTLTFDRVSASQFKKLNGSTVASLANTVTLSEGGVAELTVTADNQIIIFGSGVI